MMSYHRRKSAKAFRMELYSMLGRSIRELSAFATRFKESQSGSNAVEFAIVAPLLLTIYIGAVETTLGMSVSKRTSRAAGAIADLITQQNTTTPAQLASMTSVAESIFPPYEPRNLKLKISGIRIDKKGVPRIQWSWQKSGGRPYPQNARVTVPGDLKTADSFLVHAELQIDHNFGRVFTNFVPGGSSTITISKDFYFRQRIGERVNCPTC